MHHRQRPHRIRAANGLVDSRLGDDIEQRDIDKFNIDKFDIEYVAIDDIDVDFDIYFDEFDIEHLDNHQFDQFDQFDVRTGAGRTASHLDQLRLYGRPG